MCKRLNIGLRLDDEDFLRSPHEGNTFEFLCKRRSIERAW